MILPYPEFTGLTINENNGYSYYHSLEAETRRRFTNGVSLGTAWTWSRNMDGTGYKNATDPRPEKVIPCVVTDSPDGQFLIGRPAGQDRMIVAGGDSGHGFKHAAGIGELLAQITTGERPYCETGFLDPAVHQQPQPHQVASEPGEGAGCGSRFCRLVDDLHSDAPSCQP